MADGKEKKKAAPAAGSPLLRLIVRVTKSLKRASVGEVMELQKDPTRQAALRELAAATKSVAELAKIEV